MPFTRLYPFLACICQNLEIQVKIPLPFKFLPRCCVNGVNSRLHSAYTDLQPPYYLLQNLKQVFHCRIKLSELLLAFLIFRHQLRFRLNRIHYMSPFSFRWFPHPGMRRSQQPPAWRLPWTVLPQPRVHQPSGS